MSGNRCPVCGAALAVESINLAEGVALCSECGRLSRLSDVVEEGPPAMELTRNPPRGCLVVDGGREIVLRASVRSVGNFFGSLFAAAFWNGIVSVFLVIAVAGVYQNLVGPLPDWFPMESDDEPMSGGATLFLCLFLTPFVLVGCGLIGSVFMTAAGKVEVRVGEDEAVVATGVGKLLWKRRFDPRAVESVKSGLTSWESNGGAKELVVVHADKTVKFGSMLRDERRDWLRAMLKALLVQADSRQRRELLSAMPRGGF